MLKNVTLGTYYPGKSLIHRLQARTKLLTLFWIIVCMLIANQRLWHFATIILMLTFFLCQCGIGSHPCPRYLATHVAACAAPYNRFDLNSIC